METPGAVNLGALPERFAFGAGCSKPAVGGDERVEIKEMFKVMVSGTAKYVKW